MCRKSRVFFVALLTMFCIVVCGGLSLVSFADETSDFVGPINTTTTTTTTEPVDYTEDGPLGWIGTQIAKLGTAISNSFQSIGTFILDGIKEIFVPDPHYLDSKVAQIKSKFSPFTAIVDTFQVFWHIVEDTNFSEPPVVTVHLSNGTSHYGIDYGDSAHVLDFSWFEPYKASYDVIVSALLWLFFLWRSFRSAGSYMRGTHVTTDQAASVSLFVDKHS